MLQAWEEDEEGQGNTPRTPRANGSSAESGTGPGASRGRRGKNVGGSPEDLDEMVGGDQTDGLVARLIGACQMNQVERAFAVYEQLRRLEVPLYEGVYAMLIECCMRTQRLGHAMQFYETLTASKQRVSSRVVTLLIEACAREQHGDKVHAIWSDWWATESRAQSSQNQRTGNAMRIGEALLGCVAALIRTMSPDLAVDVLAQAAKGWGRLADLISDAEDAEELLRMNLAAARDAEIGGFPSKEALCAEFKSLHRELSQLRDDLEADAARERAWEKYPGGYNWQPSGRSSGPATPCRKNAAMRAPVSPTGLLIMDDVDLDLDLAAI